MRLYRRLLYLTRLREERRTGVTPDNHKRRRSHESSAYAQAKQSHDDAVSQLMQTIERHRDEL